MKILSYECKSSLYFFYYIYSKRTTSQINMKFVNDAKRDKRTRTNAKRCIRKVLVLFKNYYHSNIVLLG